jgi:hypothetical protein
MSDTARDIASDPTAVVLANTFDQSLMSDDMTDAEHDLAMLTDDREVVYAMCNILLRGETLGSAEADTAGYVAAQRAAIQRICDKVEKALES